MNVYNDLIISEHPEYMEFSVRCETEAIGFGSNDPRHEGPVAECIV